MTFEGNSTQKSPSIQFIKMITGEGVIADLQTGGQDEWIIKKPLQVFLDHSRGQTELVITPWLPISSTNAKEVHVSKSHVVFHVTVIADVAEYMTKYADKFYNEKPVTVKDVTPGADNKLSKDDIIRLLSDVPTDGKKN